MDKNHGYSDNGDRDGLSLSRALLIGSIAGAVHGSVALGLWNFFKFDSFPRMLSAEPLFLGYTLLGMFALGFVPGLLYAKWRTISPGVLIGGLLSLSAYGTWTIVSDGLTPVDPTPFGWYVLFWVGIVVLITIVGWGEMRLLHRRNETPREAK
jgi:hypothetical protein